MGIRIHKHFTFDRTSLAADQPASFYATDEFGDSRPMSHRELLNWITIMLDRDEIHNLGITLNATTKVMPLKLRRDGRKKTG